MDKQTLIKNFSKCARLYDRYADIQKLAALKLAKNLKEDNFSNILELGCGTGNYTLILRERFRNAKINAIDISEKMVEVAREKSSNRDIEFMVSDAEELNLEKSFDLITSNACFQWFADLERALIRYKELLKERGVIAFSTFGPLTFCELDASLKYVLKDASLAVQRFLPKNRIANILKKNFKNFKIEEIKFTQSYLKLKELLDKIRYTGIRGNGLNGKIYFSPRCLKELEETYLDKFNQIKATYQIFFCQAK